MIRSLRFRVSLLFALLMLIGNGIAMVVINRSVGANYSRYVNSADRQRAALVARFIRDSWDEWSSRPQEGDAPLPLAAIQNETRSSVARPQAGQMNPMRGRPMMSLDPPWTKTESGRILITDGEGRILLSTGSQRENDKDLDYTRGVPVTVDGRTVAYVLSGTMINREMDPADRFMLRLINRTLLLITLIATLVVLILGILLIGRLLAPLTTIEKAYDRMASGDMTARTHLATGDEIGRLGRGFDRMAEKLERSDKWKKQVIADTAHELRTPTALMLSRLEMLKEGIYRADQKQLASLYGEAENLSRLIGDMQKLYSMEAETVDLEINRADLIRLCRLRTEGFQPRAEEKGIHLVCRAEGEIMAEFDWNRTDQVLKNLLSNALRHTPEGGRIEVDARSGKEGAVITVDDTGPGVPREERERIFDRFHRLDGGRNRSDGGYGLGLAISRAIIKAQGGEISAGESPEGGARFTVEIPLSSQS